MMGLIVCIVIVLRYKCLKGIQNLLFKRHWLHQVTPNSTHHTLALFHLRYPAPTDLLIRSMQCDMLFVHPHAKLLSMSTTCRHSSSQFFCVVVSQENPDRSAQLAPAPGLLLPCAVYQTIAHYCVVKSN